jgi:hypothetical protein
MEVVLQGILDLFSILSRKEIPQIDTITSPDFLILLPSFSQSFHRMFAALPLRQKWELWAG